MRPQVVFFAQPPLSFLALDRCQDSLVNYPFLAFLMVSTNFAVIRSTISREAFAALADRSWSVMDQSLLPLISMVKEPSQVQ